MRSAVQIHGKKNWKAIKEFVPGRTDSQCRERYLNVLDPNLNRGPWSGAEEKKLLELVRIHGKANWAVVSSEMYKLRFNRNDNMCRKRYLKLKGKSKSKKTKIVSNVK